MRVMVSGPMSGYENYNFDAFREVEEHLRAKRFDVISGRLLFEQEVAQGINRTHREYLRAALVFMLGFNPDAIHLMPGWRASTGATCEAAVAKSLGLRFVDSEGNEIEAPAEIVIS